MVGFNICYSGAALKQLDAHPKIWRMKVFVIGCWTLEVPAVWILHIGSGGFHEWGIPNSWMDAGWFIMENPLQMDDLGVPPISGNHQMFLIFLEPLNCFLLVMFDIFRAGRGSGNSSTKTLIQLTDPAKTKKLRNNRFDWFIQMWDIPSGNFT